MDKKTIAIVVILGIVLIFYFQIMEFLGLYTPPVPQPVSQQQEVVDSTQAVAPPSGQSVQTPSEEVQSSASTAETAVMAMTDSITADTVVIETKKYIVTMTSFGGGPVSLKLKDYTYRDGEMIEMLPNASSATPEATFAGETFSTSSIPFNSSLAAGNYDATVNQLDLVYTYQGTAGGTIKRTLRFYPDSYHFDLELEVTNPSELGFAGKYALVWNTPIGITEPQMGMDYDAMVPVAMMSGSREQLDDFEDNKLKQSLEGNTSWGGLRSKYFAAVMIPSNRDAESVFANGTITTVEMTEGTVNKKNLNIGLNMPFANVVSLTDSFTVFVGPLDYNLMDDYNVGLEDMLDIGTTPFIGWIIKPFAIAIMWILPLLYNVIPNYGLVIILFAFMVKIITLPLSMKSFKSMNAMKEIQPKIEALKQKLKKNPQQMNSEMMKLYKEHGVNPMSGCLPMLPQMPLFFALFSVFRSTILLRDAPFIWFIDDLSRGATSFTDPYIILVVIMIASQFVSQKLTMSGGQQQKAFLYIMPLFMGFIFYKFAAGLVLYWTCFSILSLLDYFLFKRKAIKNPEVKTA